MIVSYHSIARTAFTVRLALLNSNTPDKKMRLPQRVDTVDKVYDELGVTAD
jgi:hypothetical protein